VKDRILALLRIGLGALFVYSAATKLPDMASLADSVSNYRLLPGVLVPLFSVALVGMELLAGLSLVVGVAARAAACWIALMLFAFIAALSQALIRGIDLSCGCFGSTDVEPVSWALVGRDALMLAAALILARLGTGKLLFRRGAAAAEPQTASS
jgi:uncharacterized membrane protein YphA (DoxX/SURF4 family)